MQFIGIIPARFASSRFPGKPLVEINGKSMIQRVYEQVIKALDTVVVATDDERIFKEVKRFNGDVVMTSTEHLSGTDRCAEAVDIYKQSSHKIFDVVINIQGDEPFIQPDQLKKIMECFHNEGTQIATLAKKIEQYEEIFDSNKPKVLFDKQLNAIYFSRSPIPHIRGIDENEWDKKHTFYKHIGLYAYKFDVLKEIVGLEQSSLEIAEKLEQNRWIENGYKIKIAITDLESISVDTPEDIKKIKDVKC